MNIGELRKALGCFVTGVTVVSTIDSDGAPKGFTANSFTSVSLDPPLLLVCIAKSAGSYGVFSDAKGFAINILSEDQRSLSGKFASRNIDKFADVSWHAGLSGSPLILGATAWLDCRVHQQIDAGDHTILLGEVIDFAHTPAVPLGYYSGSYVNFALERQVLNSGALVGGIFEHDGRILLVEREDFLRLPTGVSLGQDNYESNSLLGELKKLGVNVTVSFVYSVFHDKDSGQPRLFYRGEIADDVPALNPSYRLYGETDLPWSRLRAPSIEFMLRRYFSEQHEDAFGIYVGNAFEGVVHALGPGQSASRI